jgi:hypothetical protein
MKENYGLKVNKFNGKYKETNKDLNQHVLNQQITEEKDQINQKEINMEEYEEKDLNEDNYEYINDNNVKNSNKNHIYNYQGKYIEINSDFLQESNKYISRNDIEFYDSHQELSFEKNFSQENPSLATTSQKFVNDEEKDLSEIQKENKGISNLNTRQKNEIKNTSTIGEVSNENVSSLSYKDEESSVRIQNTSDNDLIEIIERSSLNLDRLDFIVKANKYVQYIQQMNYSNNRIKNMDDSLFYLGNLIAIDLSHNYINKIQNLDNCLKLKYFNISHNHIQILEGLYHLQQLEVLDVSFNKIKMDDIFIKKIRFNKSLKSVNLEGNPNYDFVELKYKILDNVNTVCSLDNKEIFKHRNKPKAKSTSNFKLFFHSGNQNSISDKPHNLKSVKEYIKFKKLFYLEEKKINNNLD